ncbi:MAG: holo-[acyl-carrier-protein] synthase [Solidesulfovibrio sp. DCME]|uniref:holo-[acyl-carrier-protein] synthase n=1 Tax=Solidesulfovibrio sp. DCME TaxID=3447380 RepID=UPI003D0EEEBE
MIVGLGLDVVELPRIASALDRFGDRFVARLLTPAERATLPPRPLARLAGLFAAKEAAVKALGTGFAQGITFHHLEILPDALGRPTLAFHGPALDRVQALGATSWHVSISHERATAAAVVVLELASGCGRYKKRSPKADREIAADT